MNDAIALLERTIEAAKSGEHIASSALTMLEAAHERERTNLQTIRELLVALKVSNDENRELRARIRAYEKEGK